MGASFYFDELLPAASQSDAMTHVELFRHGGQIWLRMQPPEGIEEPLTAELSFEMAAKLAEDLRRLLDYFGAKTL